MPESVKSGCAADDDTFTMLATEGTPDESRETACNTREAQPRHPEDR